MRKPETKLMSGIFYTKYGRFFEDEEVEASINGITLREALNSAVDSLTQIGGPAFRRQVKRVIELRFGFKGNRSHTLKEIGLEFHLSQERIRQIEAKGLRCLRHPRRSRTLEKYIKDRRD